MPQTPVTGTGTGSAIDPDPALEARVEALEAQVAELRAQLQQLLPRD